MPSVCFYFQVHQPYRLRSFDCFKIGHNHIYEDQDANQRIFERVSAKCYLPMNKLLLKLIENFKGRFKVAFSISGTALEQMEQFSPETLRSFQELVNTGCVELLGETYYHSLSYLYSKKEFQRQVELHQQKIKALFDYQPVTFRNTELIYNNELGNYISECGYSGIITEGLDRILGYRSAGFLYHPPGNQKIKCLLKNYRLSDDIAFRFSQQTWGEWPLTAPKFSHWVHRTAGNGDTVNLFMDYETFGEHQWKDSGIFEFMEALPQEILRHPDFDFKSPREVVQAYPGRGEYDVHQFSSWADEERDLSAWLGNPLQHDSIERVYALERMVKETGDQTLLNTWSRLLTSDHFYYMCTKFWNDGDVHKYFSPYPTPYEAYINYMNVLTDLEHVLETKYEVSER
jgi:alpha-amylase